MTDAEIGPLFTQPSRKFLPPSSRERFEQFHEANPHVYVELVRLARQAKASGQRVGIRLCWERLRWSFKVETRRAEGEPLLNDHWPPFYARLIMSQEPDLAGFFEVRGGT